MTSASLKTYSSVDESGRRYSKAHGRRTYLDQIKGRAVPDWWTDIGAGSHMPHKERIGYPTQKPRDLLERIISACTRRGDWVLDPFCGCATTCVAAEVLGRQWLGIDIEEAAYSLVRSRLSGEGEQLRLDSPAWRFEGEINRRQDIPQRSDIEINPPLIIIPLTGTIFTGSSRVIVVSAGFICKRGIWLSTTLLLAPKVVTDHRDNL